MKTLLWLDDIRNPKIGDCKCIIQYLAEEYLEQEVKNVEVIWVKNQHEFCKYIEENGLPDMISFDNDLGIGNGSGYDCAKWLVEYCLNNNEQLPQWYSQSMNPVAREYINNLLLNFQKSKNS